MVSLPAECPSLSTIPHRRQRTSDAHHNAAARFSIGHSPAAVAVGARPLAFHPCRGWPRITQPAPFRQLSFLIRDALDDYRITIYLKVGARRARFCSAGVPPASLHCSVIGKIAGGTPALQRQVQARGCALSYTSSSCRIVACVYRCVVDSEECPSNS